MPSFAQSTDFRTLHKQTMPPKKLVGAAAARPSLEPTPPNVTRKRAHNTSVEDAAPEPKRASTGATTTGASTKSNHPRADKAAAKAKNTVIEQQPDWAFDVVGTWKIDASDLAHALRRYSIRPEDGEDAASPFTLEIRYANSPQQRGIGRQLWATFKWGTWDGCLRMCPGHPYRLSHERFYELCVLDRGVWPGDAPRGTPVWNLRWQAKGDHGVVGATDEYETQLRFSKDEDGTMKVNGKMVVGGYKARKFSGVKTVDDVSELEKGQETVDAWWKMLKHPREESRLMICRGCKGQMDDSDEDESEPESEHDWEAERKEREDALAKEKEEEEAPWPAAMAGRWKITPQQAGVMDGRDPTAPRFMYIRESSGKDGTNRQYWAEFQFGHKWSGIMRLCPSPALQDEFGSGGTSVKQFEKACILEEGVMAGPPPQGVNDWLIKWRGPLDLPLPSSQAARESKTKDVITDEMTTNFTVRRGENGTLSLRGVMCNGVRVNPFHGVRIGDAPPRADNAPTIETLWKQRAHKEPPPPKLYEWKSPLPADPIQKPPKWAWDVLGKYKVDAPDLAEEIGIDRDEPLSMTLYMDNRKCNPKNVGRQLWASFMFESEVPRGCMRFCPLPENGRPLETVELFEKACKLKSGVWPGDVRSAKGKSFQKWGCRWRGQEADGELFRFTDQFETRMDFEMDDDGTVRLHGVFMLNFSPKTWRAVKVEDGEAPAVFTPEEIEDGTAVQGTVIDPWEAFGDY